MFEFSRLLSNWFRCNRLRAATRQVFYVSGRVRVLRLSKRSIEIDGCERKPLRWGKDSIVDGRGQVGRNAGHGTSVVEHNVRGGRYVGKRGQRWGGKKRHRWGEKRKGGCGCW